MCICFEERGEDEVKAKDFAGGGEKREALGVQGTGGGCQYKPWAEKMSKTYMREAQGDSGCFLHGTVP